MSFKFNPFTGNFDLVGHGGGDSSPDNFTYIKILSGEFVTVPLNQQMIYKGDMTVIGDLTLLGDAVEITSRNQMPVSRVNVGDVYLVPTDCVMFYRQLNVMGDLRVQGDLLEI